MLKSEEVEEEKKRTSRCALALGEFTGVVLYTREFPDASVERDRNPHSRRAATLEKIQTGAEKEARPHQLFAVDRCRTVAGTRSPMRRLVDAYNKHFNAVDINIVASFKKNIFKTLNCALGE
ncbi:hypothetical protein EVAR_102630_1 [Eumeta japonica]|uniref:Uncharacterized protein n=1 Tax=Eumeta variegata TaxID=151549 RepID=A0A4C1TUR7_EUMVA|nr:hypothetical protein EVAR_102630_1 [Eumeta japonica]